MKGKIILIPGLGADERVFQYLQLPDANVQIIRWIPPRKSESLPDYSIRLKKQIGNSADFIIGVSFGGMIALELNKIVRVRKVILISSVRDSSELPWILKLIGKTSLLSVIPSKIFRWPNSIVNLLFGVRSKSDKELLRTIIKDSDPGFAKWALTAMTKWKYNNIAENVIKIHGNKDYLIPDRTSDYVIDGGGHFMIVSGWREISAILKKEIASAWER